MKKVQYRRHDIPDIYLEKWQKTIDLIAELYEVPAALVMRVAPEQIEVLVANNTDENPYKAHEKADLGLGLYCETVMETRAELLVPNALDDPEWENNPDVELNMIHYFGVPLIWPDGSVFGTVCVLDNKTREHPDIYRKLLWHLKGIIEGDFKIYWYAQKLEESQTELENRVERRTLALRNANKDLELELEARKKAEEMLRKSEHQLQMITDSLPAFIAYVGLDDLRYRFVNSMFVEAYKLPREKIVGSHIKDIVGEENYLFAQKYLEIVRQGKAASYENSFITAGTERWVNVNYVPEFNQQGEVEAVVVLSFDITERKETEKALRESERLLRKIAESFPNSYVSIIESDFRIGFTSGREFTKRGFSPDDFVGLSLEDVFKDEAETVRKYYDETFSGQETSFELYVDGEYQYYRTVPLFSEDGSVPRILVVVENITERKQAEIAVQRANGKLKSQLAEIQELEIALRKQALHDSLTGLFNRRYMTEALERELSRTARAKGTLSIVMFDLDNLKKINDKYGHIEGGDTALKMLVETIQPLCRDEDVFCRYAGDEFVVILYETSLQAAYKRALEWRDALAKVRVVCDDGEFGITFSAGISEYPFHALTGNGLIQYADEALYQAKNLGRDRVVMAEKPDE